MIEELRKTLYADINDADLYDISFKYASSEYRELQKYMKSGFDPEKIYKLIKKERIRLQRIKKIDKSARYFDNLLNIQSSVFLQSVELNRAEDKVVRFALMRDLGADANEMKINGIYNNLSDSLLLKDLSEPEKLFREKNYFISIAKTIFGTEDNTPFLWLHDYLCKFIQICPESYLEKGIFGKLMRAIFGVMFFSRTNELSDYHTLCRLAAYFGISYLFDDILDDPNYSENEKKDYYDNVLGILRNRKGKLNRYSSDPLMSFSEAALAGIFHILDEERGSMVAQSYLAIAKATREGSKWTYLTPLTDMELYSVATVKAAYTRIIPAILSGRRIDDKFLSYCMRAGLIYQLTDDLRDIPDDLSDKNVTPFNYFSYGISSPGIHPIYVLIASICKISDDYLNSIPDARELWIMRVTHALRVLKLKCGDENISGFFMEMSFPEDKIVMELAMIAECFDFIVDIESHAAEFYSNLSVNLRGVSTKKPVYGH